MRRPCISAVTVCGFFSVLLTADASAQSFIDDNINPTTLQVYRIEEDWRLEVGEPDANVTAPQITTTVSPHQDLDGIHAIFNLNHQALDQFAPGGMQLQIWNGESPVSFIQISPDSAFATAGEVVTWTQRMTLHEGRLYFRVKDGQSTTWGTFGENSTLLESVSSGLPNLNDYNPVLSVENSGVSFAANRVDCLVLERVRIYTTDGQVFAVELNMHADQH
jgi:hypothetical protein